MASALRAIMTLAVGAILAAAGLLSARAGLQGPPAASEHAPASAGAGERASADGYWHLKSTRFYEAECPWSWLGTTCTRSGSEGAITGRVTWGERSFWAVHANWALQAEGSPDILVPGDQLGITASVSTQTDSETGAILSIVWELPYPRNCCSGCNPVYYADMFANGSRSDSGGSAVPAGPFCGSNEMALRANAWYAGEWERTYEWVPGPPTPATPGGPPRTATPRPTATTQPTATTRPTPTAAYDLTIGDVEFTQVVQCLQPAAGDTTCADNSLPLLQGKLTAVRVFPVIGGAVSPSDRPADNTPVTARLVRADGGGVLAPVNTAVLRNQDAKKNREGRDTTLNFHLPPAWTRQATLNFDVTINPDKALPETNYANNARRVTIQFKPSSRLTIRYFPVWLVDGRSWAKPDLAVAKTAQRIIQRWYPLSDTAVDYQKGSQGLKYWASFPVRTGSPDEADKVALVKWFDRQVRATRLAGSKVDQYVGWLFMPPVAGGFWYGISDPSWLDLPDPGRGKSVVIRSYGSAEYGLAHEIAHNLGARHPNKGAGCDAYDGKLPPDWPYATGRIQEVGYDAWAAGGAVRPPDAPTFDLMCYSPDPEKWMSPHTYKVLDAGLRALHPGAALVSAGAPVGHALAGAARSGPAGPGAARTAQATIEMAIVSGTVHRDGSVEPDPLLRGPGLPEEASPQGTGSYCVVIEGLASSDGRCFEPDFLGDNDEPVDVTGFLFVMPVPEGAHRVVVMRSGAAVAEVRASAHAPEVDIDAPGAGDRWEGLQSIRWTASDADGDRLTYLVSYSHDGEDWRPLASDITASELEADFGELPGSAAARIRVMASDGFLATTAETGPLAVPRKGPQPVVLEPEDGAEIAFGQPVILVASGYDLEDGSLDESRLTWTSDLDGALGSGAEVVADGLSEGDHRLTLTATDSDGMTGSDTIAVHVRRSHVYMPLALRRGVPAEAHAGGGVPTATATPVRTTPPGRTATAPPARTATATPTRDAVATAVAATLTARAPTVAPTVAPSATATAQPWRTILDDRFCDPSSGWPSADNPYARYGYLIGGTCEYQIQLKTAPRWQRVTPQRAVSGDYAVETVAHATGEGVYGLAFGLTASGDRFYVFYVSTARRYGLSRYDSGAWTVLVPAADAPTVDPKWGNSLRVEVHGTDVGLYLDGSLLVGWGDQTAHDGQYGLYAESSAAGFDARFGRYAVQAP